MIAAAPLGVFAPAKAKAGTPAPTAGRATTTGVSGAVMTMLKHKARQKTRASFIYVKKFFSRFEIKAKSKKSVKLTRLTKSRRLKLTKSTNFNGIDKIEEIDTTNFGTIEIDSIHSVLVIKSFKSTK